MNSHYYILQILMMCALVALVHADSPNAGVAVRVDVDGAVVTLAAMKNIPTFRISVDYSSNSTSIPEPASAIPTVMVVDDAASDDYTPFFDGVKCYGISTSFGSICVDKATGGMEMKDTSGEIIAKTSRLSSLIQPTTKLLRGDTCPISMPNIDVSNGARTPDAPNGVSVPSRSECCGSCDKDSNCETWIFSTDLKPPQPNCWHMRNVTATHSATNRIVGGKLPVTHPTILLNLDRKDTTYFMGSGAGFANAKTLTRTSGDAFVKNTDVALPFHFSSDGYHALAVTNATIDSSDLSVYPVQWSAEAKGSVTWYIQGLRGDLYLSPAKSIQAGISSLYKLTGKPTLPPRYMFGFLACRWGWKDSSYIEDILTQFRNGSYPLDGFIMDYEWFTPIPDGDSPAGDPNYKDFSFSNVTFPNPVKQLKLYHEKFNVKFGGIRKPRLYNQENLAYARNKNWVLQGSSSGGSVGQSRSLDFSKEDLRQWYSDDEQNGHFLADGVDFFWNDEGECSYFTFHHWNVALRAAHDRHRPNMRFISINRSFSPGLSRLGGVLWTGDIGVSFSDLANQPGYMLNYALGGMPYTGCDIGGFSGGDPTSLLLIRWYQMGVFLPIMRVHSSHDNTPHFPFLWGVEAGDAMRSALNLRYQLIPYHYSLAHRVYAHDIPMFQPLGMVFENVSETYALLTSLWMDGDSLLVAPIMNENNSTEVFLPIGPPYWYEFGSNIVHDCGTVISLTNVPLNYIPMYVRAGGMITLAPVIQSTNDLPGGPLQLQVYGGTSSTFTMVEDDGMSMDYAQDKGIRRTTFQWNESNQSLNWSVVGATNVVGQFTQLQVYLYSKSGNKVSSVVTLTDQGSLQL